VRDICRFLLQGFEFTGNAERKAETADFDKTQSADSLSADIEHLQVPNGAGLRRRNPYDMALIDLQILIYIAAMQIVI